MRPDVLFIKRAAGVAGAVAWGGFNVDLAERVGVRGQDPEQPRRVLHDDGIRAAERLGDDHRGALVELLVSPLGDLDGFDIAR